MLFLIFESGCWGFLLLILFFFVLLCVLWKIIFLGCRCLLGFWGLFCWLFFYVKFNKVIIFFNKVLLVLGDGLFDNFMLVLEFLKLNFSLCDVLFIWRFVIVIVMFLCVGISEFVVINDDLIVLILLWFVYWLILYLYVGL